MAAQLKVITIHGSLRKGSFNHALARTLPKLAPAGMSISECPPWGEIPLYNADDQGSSGFPAPVKALGDAIRAADGVRCSLVDDAGDPVGHVRRNMGQQG